MIDYEAAETLRAEPLSRLTMLRPAIWSRAIELATRVTGYSYPHKLPLADGTAYGCGGTHAPITSRTEKIKRLKESIKDFEKYAEEFPDDKGFYINRIQEFLEELRKLEELETPLATPVPEGAMEWLLHEVGHWVVADQRERSMVNYGFGSKSGPGHEKAREWQAWAFEEMVLAPFGHAREIAPPAYRGGTGFTRNEIPASATQHAESSAKVAKIALGEWRALYGEWIVFELSTGTPSWKQ